MMFGGSLDQYTYYMGKEEAYDEACDALGDYLDFINQLTASQDPSVMDRAETTKGVLLHCRVLITEDFPFCAEAYRTMAIIFSREGLHDQALQCCSSAALVCHEATDPHLAQADDVIEWGEVDNWPFLRALNSQATCLEAAGKTKKAKKCLRKNMQLNPRDNIGCRMQLFFLCLATDDLDVAEQMARDHKDENDATFLWGNVVLKFIWSIQIWFLLGQGSWRQQPCPISVFVRWQPLILPPNAVFYRRKRPSTYGSPWCQRSVG
jgi:tetratricopeptide (TPR) repeat protein